MTKILNDSNIFDTLAILGALKAGKALSANEKAMKKAAADLAYSKKAEAFAKKGAPRILREKIKACALARKPKKQQRAARAKATNTESARGTKRKASFSSTVAVKKAKTARSAAATKSTAASSAKRKADVLKTHGTKAKKKVKSAVKAVASAKKTKGKVAKKKLPRTLAGLTSNLNR